jgi:hypothetical protein
MHCRELRRQREEDLKTYVLKWKLKYNQYYDTTFSGTEAVRHTNKSERARYKIESEIDRRDASQPGDSCSPAGRCLTRSLIKRHGQKTWNGHMHAARTLWSAKQAQLSVCCVWFGLLPFGTFWNSCPAIISPRPLCIRGATCIHPHCVCACVFL